MWLQGLLDILDVIWNTLREHSDRFHKMPGLIGIQAEMHSWSDCIAPRCYTLYLFADSHAPSYFKLYRAETTFSGVPNKRNCCLRCSCADHGVDRHGCSWCRTCWREQRTDSTSFYFTKRIKQCDFQSAERRGGLSSCFPFGEQQVQRFMKRLMVKTRTQRRKQLSGTCKASPTECWRRSYLSDTGNSLPRRHLHNYTLTCSHYAVSRAEAAKEPQAIATPLHLNDFHAAGIPKVSAGTWRNRARASPG